MLRLKFDFAQMRNLVSGTIGLLLIAGLLTACDSSEDPSDSELIVGNWTAVEITDSQGDRTADLEATGDLTVRFTNDQYTISFDFADPNEADEVVSGPYLINQNLGTVSLQVTFLGAPIQVPVEYQFVDEDTIEFTLDALVMNQVLQTEYEGSVTMMLQRM